MPGTTTQVIRFSPDRTATAVFSSAESSPDEIVSALNLPPYNAVLLVIGGADSLEEKYLSRLKQLFGRGIATAALKSNAIILDGGTNTGVPKLMGGGVASRNFKTSLIGIAPKSFVTFPQQNTEIVQGDSAPLEPNHSHFVLTEGAEWGSETATLFKLADALAGRRNAEPKTEETASFFSKTKLSSNGNGHAKPVAEEKQQNTAAVTKPLAILAGGGAISRNEVLQAVRRGYSLIVVQGTGGLADEIATAAANKDVLPDDADLAEIVAEGDLHFYSINDMAEGMDRLITREMGTDKVLLQVWDTFATYDKNASRQENWFAWMQFAILVLGVAGTGLAIWHEIKKPAGQEEAPKDALYYILILIPIILTLLVTASNRFKQGSKWLLLRAGSESIKREIYRYRVRGYYKVNAEQELTQKVEDITRRTMRTEVNTSSLRLYKGKLPPSMYAAGGKDDGFSFLTPDRYVEIRLADQLAYFRKKAVTMEKQLLYLSWGIFLAGGLGTFLAAIQHPVWIALTTAVAAAFGTYLGYRQTENTLTKYNQAATDLTNVKGWWDALSAAEQASQKNINLLVDHTERVLQTELDGWVQQMQDALASLRKEQEVYIKSEEPDDTPNPPSNPPKKEATHPEPAAQPAAENATSGEATEMVAAQPEPTPDAAVSDAQTDDAEPDKAAIDPVLQEEIPESAAHETDVPDDTVPAPANTESR